VELWSDGPSGRCLGEDRGLKLLTTGSKAQLSVSKAEVLWVAQTQGKKGGGLLGAHALAVHARLQGGYELLTADGCVCCCDELLR
jgi:hypothetical protein